MKSFSFDKLPDIKNCKAENDYRAETQINIWLFLKDTLWDNIFVFPLANILYMIVIVGGVLLAVFAGDFRRLVEAIVLVGVMKGVFIMNLVKIHRSFKKAGIFPIVTDEGLTYMCSNAPGQKKYTRLTTIRWEDVKKVRVYKNFVSLERKDIKSVKDDLSFAYLWDDDIPALTEQILYRWKAALDKSGRESDGLIIYSEKDEAEVCQFITDQFGEFDSVYHEMISPDLHIDIAMIPPQEGRDYYTLCTIGAGAYRMNIDNELRRRYRLSEHSEFLMYLPSDWKLDDESLKDESNYWPIRLLKKAARLSRATDSWLGVGHTIGSEDGEPYSDTLPYNSAVLLYPAPYLTEVHTNCNVSSGKTIAFHQLLPITQEELDYKLEKGLSELMELVFTDDNTVTETIINRLNK